MGLNHSRTGSVLIVALWVVAMLAAIGMTIRTALSTEIRVLRYRVARIHAMSWARAGVYLALQRLANDANQPGEHEDWLGDDWALANTMDADDPPAWEVSMPAVAGDPVSLSGTVRIQIVDEERKLDLNRAGVSELERLLGDSVLAQAILAYRTPRPIQRLEELWDLPEMSQQAEAQRVILEHGTVWTEGRVNLNTIQREVLAVLVADPALIDRLVESRTGPDGLWGTVDDCKATALSTAAAELASCAAVDGQALVSVLANPAFRVSSSVFRILAVGRVDRPAVRYRIDAVVHRRAAQSFQIVEWREG